jgi:3-methyladenine DNA glycosylase AlkD
MNYEQAMNELERLGTAQNRKIYARHGVGPAMFGVSFGGQRKLAKNIGTDHALARWLWKSGNHDARVLATMVADPTALSPRELDTWVRSLDNYVITDSFSGMVARTRHARTKARKWSRTKGEWTGRAGWNLLARIALEADDLPAKWFEPWLRVIEKEIHSRRNRQRDAMNAALIAIGMRSDTLEKKATAAAKRIGKVDVDHGETGCKTPDAAEYIGKARKRRRRPA